MPRIGIGTLNSIQTALKTGELIRFDPQSFQNGDEEVSERNLVMLKITPPSYV